MVEDHKHDFETRAASIQRPYHFVNSGLPNVYLIGIKFKVCRHCGMQKADIPAIENLMCVIARAVVKKSALLTGQEIRYLRKRLGIKSSEFAKVIGVTPEHLSRLESSSDKYNQSEAVDKLVRIYYSLMSGDDKLKDLMNSHIDSYMATLTGEDQIGSFRAERNNQGWTAEPVQASH
jgi:putative zinc finger/helix-turn-helix YgiT family protein